jgi:hypothetical protein
MTLLVGTIVTIGALYVEKLGGAFQVNQYLSGIFSIPMIIPFIMGVVFWKPQPWWALASMFVGIVLGVVLNAGEYFSWEIATLIEVIVCIIVFLGSGFFLTKDIIYNEKVTAFFKKLSTPAPIEGKSDSSVIGGLMGLYVIAFLVTGSMFVFMGIPSFEYLSGKLAVGSGLICLIGSFIFYSKRRKKVN